MRPFTPRQTPQPLSHSSGGNAAGELSQSSKSAKTALRYRASSVGHWTILCKRTFET